MITMVVSNTRQGGTDDAIDGLGISTEQVDFPGKGHAYVFCALELFF